MELKMLFPDFKDYFNAFGIPRLYWLVNVDEDGYADELAAEKKLETLIVIGVGEREGDDIPEPSTLIPLIMLFGLIGLLLPEVLRALLLFSLILLVLLLGEKGLLFALRLLLLFSSAELGLLLLKGAVWSFDNWEIDYWEAVEEVEEGIPVVYSACSMFLSSYKSSISVFLWLFKMLVWFIPNGEPFPAAFSCWIRSCCICLSRSF